MSNTPLTDQLQIVLANTYALYLKTQVYHWNVTGENFTALHALFEEQYTELAAAIDEAAEHARFLGIKVPASFALLSQQNTIGDADEAFTAQQMVADLIKAQDTITTSLKSAQDAAEDAQDDVVADFMIGRQAVHRKNKWILESIAA